MRILICSAIVALAGCTNTTRHAEVSQPGKAVAFYSNNEVEYREGARNAEEWCRETYDTPAHYLTRRSDAGGNVVTFECATD
jgi:hypothetical protein